MLKNASRETRMFYAGIGLFPLGLLFLYSAWFFTYSKSVVPISMALALCAASTLSAGVVLVTNYMPRKVNSRSEKSHILSDPSVAVLALSLLSLSVFVLIGPSAALLVRAIYRKSFTKMSVLLLSMSAVTLLLNTTIRTL